MTGLTNRREFQRIFAEQIRVARQKNENLSVCACDLDCFKNVNDSHGHATGDRVLMEFADILRGSLRKSDLLARMGGDEFMIALPQTSAAEAHLLVERVESICRM